MQYLQTLQPITADDAALKARLKNLGKPVITQSDIRKLTEIETAEAQKRNLEDFKFDSNDIKAFGILGVSVGLKWKKIQDKFKVLVKKFHPDMNSGNKKYEEKLKLITLAYTQLKNTYRDKIDTKS